MMFRNNGWKGERLTASDTRGYRGREDIMIVGQNCRVKFVYIVFFFCVSEAR